MAAGVLLYDDFVLKYILILPFSLLYRHPFMLDVVVRVGVGQLAVVAVLLVYQYFSSCFNQGFRTRLRSGSRRVNCVVRI